MSWRRHERRGSCVDYRDSPFLPPVFQSDSWPRDSPQGESSEVWVLVVLTYRLGRGMSLSFTIIHSMWVDKRGSEVQKLPFFKGIRSSVSTSVRIERRSNNTTNPHLSHLFPLFTHSECRWAGRPLVAVETTPRLLLVICASAQRRSVSPLRHVFLH